MSSAVRDNRRLIMVTMNDPNDWADHKRMLEQGFSAYQLCHFLSEGDRVGLAEVEGGVDDHVELLAGQDFSYALGKNEDLRICLSGLGFVYAPVAQGQHAGFAHVFLDQTPVGKIPLVYGQTVERQPEEKPSVWQRLFGGMKI